MSPMPHAQRRVCLVIDIEKYSSRLNSDHLAMQPQLRKVAEAAAGHAGVRWAEVDVQNQGDGLLLQLPCAIDEPRVLPRLVNGLCLALQQSNEQAMSFRRMRLRAALTEGIQHPGETGAIGESLIDACRLVDSPAARLALEARPDRSLVVIVADNLYRDVIAQKYPGLDPAAFTPVVAEIKEKNFKAAAWVHVPEPGGGELAELDRLESPALLDRAGQVARGAVVPGAVGIAGGMIGGVVAHSLHPTPPDHSPAPLDHGHDGSGTTTGFDPGAAHSS